MCVAAIESALWPKRHAALSFPLRPELWLWHEGGKRSFSLRVQRDFLRRDWKVASDEPPPPPRLHPASLSIRFSGFILKCWAASFVCVFRETVAPCCVFVSALGCCCSCYCFNLFFWRRACCAAGRKSGPLDYSPVLDP